MKPPTLCVIHEAVGNQSAIAKVARDGVLCALRAGWKVTVVAKDLDPALRAEVEWLPLYVPPRGFLLKWLTAGGFIRAALKGRTFDVIHAHQPQAAALSNVFTCHYLTRAVKEHHGLPSWRKARSALARLQILGALPAEDRCYRRWNPKTHLLFCSQLLREEFFRHYPRPHRSEVLENACPPPNIPREEERRAAREKIIGREWAGPVVGYLGGLDERKGYRQLLQALEPEETIFLLLGGPSTAAFAPTRLPGRCKPLGWIADPPEFFAACDALIVPSTFDPCPLAVLDAVAHGVPVIATPGVGNLPTLLQYGAGAEWEPGASLGNIVRAVAARRPAFQAGALRMAAALSQARQSARLLELYETIRCENHGLAAAIP
ncbi:MAG: glycosyltransferase family 4 protein [Chthoniobacteraceae bacterium]|nr:glycosyltransferase family 4 protein [Chthoniobacteraceae bacterium]